jgi:hypothetical protein
MKGGKRALSPWNIFVKKIYREGKTTDSNYAFKDALKDASKRKGEMGSSSMGSTKKMKKSRSKRGKRFTRRRH